MVGIELLHWLLIWLCRWGQDVTKMVLGEEYYDPEQDGPLVPRPASNRVT